MKSTIEWIDIAEKRPPENGLYLRTSGAIVETLYFVSDDGGWWWENDEGSLVINTTYWANLPKFPTRTQNSKAGNACW